MPANRGSQGKVNINTANRQELLSVDGVNDAIADAIIDYRESNDGFDDAGELDRIPGIPGDTLEDLKSTFTTSPGTYFSRSDQPRRAGKG